MMQSPQQRPSDEPPPPGSAPAHARDGIGAGVLRLCLGAVLTLSAGVAFNALLLQKPGHETGAHGRSLAPTAPQSAPPPGKSAPAGSIKTTALPAPPPLAPPPALPPTTTADLNVWQDRLLRLEHEARGLAAAVIGRAAASHETKPPAEVEDPLAPAKPQTIRAIQRELALKGYDPGPADGNLGMMTTAAIMAFEHDEGLNLTGEPSERLLRHIILGRAAEDAGADAASQRPAETVTRLVRAVQQGLATLNYAPGMADGSLSEETVRAIREFEMDQGLVPTGRISGRLIVRLSRAAGKSFSIPVR
jgi:peptidoglycan hydrolase-like protein with peptidoglycan-binding domain